MAAPYRAVTKALTQNNAFFTNCQWISLRVRSECKRGSGRKLHRVSARRHEPRVTGTENRRHDAGYRLSRAADGIARQYHENSDRTGCIIATGTRLSLYNHL